MGIRAENLIFLVWKLNPEPITRVVKECPPDVYLDLEGGIWRYETGDLSDPARIATYRIGSRDYRDVVGHAFIYGPIAVFDQTNIDHLDNLIAIVEKMAFDAPGRV